MPISVVSEEVRTDNDNSSEETVVQYVSVLTDPVGRPLYAYPAQ